MSQNTDRFRHHAAQILQLQTLDEMKTAIDQVPEKWRDTVARYVRCMIELDRARSRYANTTPNLPCNRAHRR